MSTFTVLIADPFSPACAEKLEKDGFTVVFDDKLKDEKLVDAINAHKPTVLVVGSAKIQVPHLNPSLKVIIRAGSGYDTIDSTAAGERGIAVCNTPGMNSVAVSELVFGHIVNYDRKIVENVTSFGLQQWNKGAYAKSKGLKWSTLGIIGYGNIGKQVAQRAKAFEMNVLSYDPYLADEVFLAGGVTRVTDINDIAKSSDIITVHCPGGAETKNLINKEFLNNMKDGALLVNTARGTVVDEDALLEAVNKKNIYAAVDVIVGEPQIPKKEFGHHFQGIPNIAVTHHIGASTLQAERACGEETVNVIETFARTGKILHQVNKVN